MRNFLQKELIIVMDLWTSIVGPSTEYLSKESGERNCSWTKIQDHFISSILSDTPRKLHFQIFPQRQIFTKKIFLETFVSQFIQKRTNDHEKRECSIDAYRFLRKILDSY